jgi:DNA topoisomerase-1
LDRDDDVLALGLNRAVDLLAKKMASVRTIGPHPASKDLISVRKGRFGPYVQHGKTVANLPRGVAMEEISLDDAVKLLAERGKALKPRGAAGRKGKAGAKTGTAETGAKSPARKAAKVTKAAEQKQEAGPKKAAAKKAVAKKATAKKAGAKTPSAKAAVKMARRAAE